MTTMKANKRTWGDLIEISLFYITAITALGATIIFFVVGILTIMSD